MEKQLDTIIVLRNDHGEGPKFGTADSNVILRAGEVGVHYLDNGNVMVKAGDGSSSWADLPQVEAVFEEDQTITRSFGKYTTSDSKPIKAGGAGMTVSQWLMHCLSEVIEATVTQPSYSLAASTITTDTSTTEVGSNVTKLAWNGTFSAGSYSYGSKTDTNNNGKIDENDTWDKTTATGVTASYVMTSSNAGTFDKQAVDGTLTLTTPIRITDAASIDCGSITGKCTWTASSKQPVNNIGNADKSPIAANTTGVEKTASYSTSGYRAWFYGYKAGTAKLDVDAIDSTEIRKLTAANGSFPATLTTNKMQQMFFAAPAGKINFTLKADGSTVDTGFVVADNTNGAPQTVKHKVVFVKGANNYVVAADAATETNTVNGMKYDLFYVNNDNANGGESTYKITVTKN